MSFFPWLYSVKTREKVDVERRSICTVINVLTCTKFFTWKKATALSWILKTILKHQNLCTFCTQFHAPSTTKPHSPLPKRLRFSKYFSISRILRDYITLNVLWQFSLSTWDQNSHHCTLFLGKWGRKQVHLSVWCTDAKIDRCVTCPYVAHDYNVKLKSLRKDCVKLSELYFALNL